MEHRVLGKTTLRVSPLGLGTVKFGRNQGVKYPYGFALPSDQAIVELLALTKDLGINVLDTAPAYGTSEERLGKLLTHRHDWIIIGKTGEAFTNNQSVFDFTPEYTIQSVHNSLKKLNTDYIDVLLIHSNGNDLEIIHNGIFDVLISLKQQGKIRAYGMSTKTLAGGIACVEQADVVMATYNQNHTAELPVIKKAYELNKGVLIKKGLNSGHLPSSDDNPVEKAMQFIFQEPGVGSVIVGTLNPNHLKHNATTVKNIIHTK